ncbi:putative protein kinase [Trypanosoma grayi]|uniref:putative protein kinase n=1 Tax=Trypanosoma grayi TaxID=71804 RepID=UPI0004F426DC|nr:putative protein kinase [Trypanosoma grayi]KEG10672.1 putative protein kinase [Trypanosoma grayi]
MSESNSLSDVALPLEALGARALIRYAYKVLHQVSGDTDIPTDNGHVNNADTNDNSCSDPLSCMGLPLPDAEPIDAQSGRRLVYFRRHEKPAPIIGERRPLFLHIVFHPPTPAKSLSAAALKCLSAHGTLLGYSDDDTELIWHERGELFASRVPLSAIASVKCMRALRCFHCAHVVPRQEVIQHLAMHLKGRGCSVGTFTGHHTWGTACGDTGLLQQLRRVRVIGSGAQGEVVLCEAGPEEAGQQYALKSMRCESEEVARGFYHRAVHCMSLRHAHLVEYLTARLLPDGRTTEIVMPFYSEGDLADAIRRFTGNRFDESYICSIALQIASALGFLHERNPPIVHGDIKVENVLFFNKGQQVVLTDLDTCTELSYHKSSVHVDLGTTAWMAPEALHKQEIMPASDMWALGLVMYVLSILPDFPMMMNPNTGDNDLLNACVWETYENSTTATTSPETVEAVAVKTTTPITTTPITKTPITTTSAMGATDFDPFSDALRAVGAYGGSETASGDYELSYQRLSKMRLADCVKLNVSKRGYSTAFAQLTAVLLSYDPARRPNAAVVTERLTDIMTTLLVT